MRHSAISVLALAFLLGTAEQARADCKPAAVPIGDPALVQNVIERLTANGVTTSPIEGCPAVRVHLERRGEQLHLRVADGFQRRGERQVQDVATAAAVIESWTLQEIEEGMLPEVRESAPTFATVPASPRSERIVITASGHSSMAGDATTWVGAEASACWRIGAACLGASTSLVADTSTTEDVTRGSQRSKEIHALVTFEVPRQWGRFRLSPGLGLGYGWMFFAQQHLDQHAMPFSAEYTSHSLQMRAHVAFSREVVGTLAVQATVFGELAALRTAIPDGPTTAPRARAGASLGLRLGL